MATSIPRDIVRPRWRGRRGIDVALEPGPARTAGKSRCSDAEADARSLARSRIVAGGQPVYTTRLGHRRKTELIHEKCGDHEWAAISSMIDAVASALMSRSHIAHPPWVSIVPPLKRVHKRAVWQGRIGTTHCC